MLKKQTNKQNTHRKVIQISPLQRFGEKKSYPNQITHILPPPPFVQAFRRTRRLVEKNNNNNQNFLRGNLDLQGQCVCKLKKVPLFTKSLL